MKFNCAIIGYGYMGEIRHKIIKKIFNLNIKYIVDLDISLIPKNKNYTYISVNHILLNQYSRKEIMSFALSKAYGNRENKSYKN